MCLIAFAIDAHPACPVLIASNRDEFLQRPTAALHRWRTPQGAEVVGGRDLRDGGTWLGVSPLGRVAMLTNVRDAQTATGRRSRGELVTRWLEGDLGWAALQASIDPGDYGGFNLVVGDFHDRLWGWLSNRDPEQPHAAPAHLATALHARSLSPGVYGLSNAALDTPWPKTQRLVQAVWESLVQCHTDDATHLNWLAPLTSALGESGSAPDHDLPLTGMPLEMERSLSSPFVCMPERGYGTRSTLVVRVAPLAHAVSGWQVSLDEWTHHHPQGDSGSGGERWAAASHHQERLVW